MTTYIYEEVTSEETDILQEVMNIAFGKASADLAEIIDIYVVLSIPNILLLKATDVPEHLEEDIKKLEPISVVHQNYWGKFKGTAILVFPAAAGKILANMLDHEYNPDDAFNDDLEHEKDTLAEIGNILIGACVGKLAELLDDVITFSPPRILVADTCHDIVPADMFDEKHSAILMKTLFSFENQDVKGFLFLVPDSGSFGWLKKALHVFMERYLDGVM